MAKNGGESAGATEADIRRRRLRLWLGLLLATVTAIVALLVSLRPGDEPSSPGQIAFVSNRDGNLEIYVVTADGSSMANITRSPHAEHSPAWSPDGRHIAFVSGSDESFDIFVAQPDGTGPVNLTSSPAPYYGGLTWSPDGTRLSFYSRRGEGLLWPELSVINSDGSGLIKISGTPTYSPRTSWSPDGEQIVFSSGFEVGANIYVLNADGASLRRLTDVTHNADLLARQADVETVHRNALSAENPVWSPDNRLIAFTIESEGHSGVSGIYTLGPDGSLLTQVTSNPGTDLYPNWSPDGRSIAFISRQVSGLEIQVIILDGSKKTLASQVGLHSLLDFNAGPSWSPDGRHIAFVSNRDGNQEIYVIDANGSNERRLTNHPGSDFQPVWSSVKSK
jgi:Tol biopolymer transport system component